MKKEEEPLPWVKYYQDLLKELRCADHPIHRVQSVELLLEQQETINRNSSLMKAAINEPDPVVKDKILRLLFDHFGKKLYTMLEVEKSDGGLVEDPWLLGCTDPRNRVEKVKISEFNFIDKLDYEQLLKEIRCQNSAGHRIAAAHKLTTLVGHPYRIAYLVNVVLYDPDTSVRQPVKELLLDIYGNELETMIKVEGADGVPIESPWMLPCRLSVYQNGLTSVLQDDSSAEDLPLPNDLAELYDALRDPSDAKTRQNAAKALAKNHTDDNLEMLAKAVLFDPDENVQQQAYQSLYEAAGDDKADALLDEIANQTSNDDEEWLLLPDYVDEDQEIAETKEDTSPFGLNKADQIRGMVNLFTGEADPQKRIVILQALAQMKDVTVNEAIARVGLFDADARVREFARMELEKRLGSHLDEFLDHIYNTSSAIYPDPEEEIEESNEAVENQVVSKQTYDNFSDQLKAQPPVIEESSNLKPLIIISALVIIGMILYLFIR